MAGLTASETEEMVGIITEVHRQLGLTVLVIEHNIRLVLGISHRVTVLNYGRIIAEGTPETIVEDPTVIKAYLGQRWAAR